MKYAKQLGLAALSIGVLLIFAGVASATVVTSNGALFTGTLAGASEGHVSLHGENGITIECSLSLEGVIEKHGAAVTGEGKYSEVAFPNCTNNYVVHTKEKGMIIGHAIGGGNATVTSAGTKAEVTAPTIFGTIICVYHTGSGVDIGTFTGSKTTGAKGTIDFKATIPRTEGSSLCGASGIITGTAVINSPTNLNVD
jgi:hypothetical protein